MRKKRTNFITMTKHSLESLRTNIAQPLQKGRVRTSLSRDNQASALAGKALGIDWGELSSTWFGSTHGEKPGADRCYGTGRTREIG